MQPTDIGGSRWDDLLRRLFSVKGGAIAPVLGAELMPIMVAQPDGPEMAWLRSERRRVFRQSQAAVAGQYSHVWVYHNVNSGQVLTVLERVFIFTATTSTIDIYIGTSGPTAGTDDNRNRFLDFRIGTAAAPNTTPLSAHEANAAILPAAANVCGRFRTPAEGTWIDLGLVIPPIPAGITNLSICFVNVTVNEALTVTAFSRSRQAEQSEY